MFVLVPCLVSVFMMWFVFVIFLTNIVALVSMVPLGNVHCQTQDLAFEGATQPELLFFPFTVIFIHFARGSSHGVLGIDVLLRASWRSITLA